MFKKLIVIILLFQFSMPGLACAADNTKKDPWSAALKSAVFPGWGQYQNGEDAKAKSIILGNVIEGLLYLNYSEILRDKEHRNVDLSDKYSDMLMRDYCAILLGAGYVGNIVDAYFSANNQKNKLAKKDLKTALGLTALLPGLGQLYIGDDIYEGVGMMASDLFWLNKLFFGKTELQSGTNTINVDKTMTSIIYPIFWVAYLVRTYFQVMAHNENADKPMKQEGYFEVYPKANILEKQLALVFRKDF